MQNGVAKHGNAKGNVRIQLSSATLKVKER